MSLVNLLSKTLSVRRLESGLLLSQDAMALAQQGLVQAKPHLNQEEQKLLCRYFLSKRRLFDHVARQRVLKSELKFLNEGPVGSTGNPLKM